MLKNKKNKIQNQNNQSWKKERNQLYKKKLEQNKERRKEREG